MAAVRDEVLKTARPRLIAGRTERTSAPNGIRIRWLHPPDTLDPGRGDLRYKARHPDRAHARQQDRGRAGRPGRLTGDGCAASAVILGPVPSRDEIVRRYSEYIDACNRRAWDEVGNYVAARVLVNGSARSRSEYVADVVATTSVFPDYRWELRRVVLEGEWLAVHLHDTGTRLSDFLGARGDGARVETDEFDMYRIVDGLIVEVEGTADNARLCR